MPGLRGPGPVGFHSTAAPLARRARGFKRLRRAKACNQRSEAKSTRRQNSVNRTSARLAQKKAGREGYWADYRLIASSLLAMLYTYPDVPRDTPNLPPGRVSIWRAQRI